MHQKSSSTNPDLGRLDSGSPDSGSLVFFFLCFSLLLLALLPSQTRWINGISFVKQPAFWSLVSIGMMLSFSIISLCIQKKNIVQIGKDFVHCLLQQKSLLVIENCGYYFLYVWLVPLIGYLPSSILFMVLLTWRYGFRDKTMLLGSVLTAIVIVVLFKSMMRLHIPAGQIYAYLPDAMRDFFIFYF